jgi:hypothetical protein
VLEQVKSQAPPSLGSARFEKQVAAWIEEHGEYRYGHVTGSAEVVEDK